MKHHPQFRRLKQPLLVFLAACLAGSRLFAQETSAKVLPKTSKAPAYVLEVTDGILLSDNQKQPATLSRIADVLRGIYPDVNIVLAPELGQEQVKDLKLRSAQVPEALEALRVASGDAFVWQNGLAQGGSLPGPVDPNTGLPISPPQGREQSSLYILSRNNSYTPGNPRRMVEVFNLSGYLEQLGKRDEKEIAASLEKIKMIVSDTLNQVLQGNVHQEDQPSFQFHPGANLFIVIGPSQAIDVTRKVVDALPGVAGGRAHPARVTDPTTNEAFMRRYGLIPPTGNPPTTRPPGTVAPTPGK